MREAGFKNIDKAAAKRRLLRRYAPRNCEPEAEQSSIHILHGYGKKRENLL